MFSEVLTRSLEFASTKYDNLILFTAEVINDVLYSSVSQAQLQAARTINITVLIKDLEFSVFIFLLTHKSPSPAVSQT